jgi:hypothetical protein
MLEQKSRFSESNVHLLSNDVKKGEKKILIEIHFAGTFVGVCQ